MLNERNSLLENDLKIFSAKAHSLLQDEVYISQKINEYQQMLDSLEKQNKSLLKERSHQEELI